MANFGPCPAPYMAKMVQTEFQASIYIKNRYCFSKICPSIDIWGWRVSRWPILGHFRTFPAISGPIHGPRWSRLCFNHPFYIGNQYYCTKFCPKINIWGWRSSRWPSFGRSRPPRGPRRSSPKQKLSRIWFHSHLKIINFALKCIPEAVLDGLLLLAVALKANLRDHPILVFWGPLTSPKTWKVVSFMVVFLPFSFLIWPHSVLMCPSL